MKSRRERMVYVIATLTFAFGAFCIYHMVPLVEATAFSTPILALAGYYVKQETDRKSEI